MDEDQCGICQHNINEKTRIAECSHCFCYKCIAQWANVSNTCPLCQGRFFQLYRMGGGKKSQKIKHVDHREENAMRVMEEFDSEECSIVDTEESLGSDGDLYESDFVVPDGVVIKDDDTILDMRELISNNPFSIVHSRQPDSIIKTAEGKIITISWESNEKQQSNDSDDDLEYEVMSLSDDDDEEEEEDEEESESSLEENVKIIYAPPRN